MPVNNKSYLDLVDIFKEHYPRPETELNYSNPFELLIAVILSAQTTDKQVNKVTSHLFENYNTPEKLLALGKTDLENYIRSIGLFHNKARYILDTCQILIEKFGGEVPNSRKKLMKLPGVGRKTANVVLACLFEKETFPVDTHVARVARRLGITDANKPDRIEICLQKIFPKNNWVDLHHWFIYHGRNFCQARNPRCKECLISDYCEYFRG